MAKPLFKLRIFISQHRHLELLIWPESTRDGNQYPIQPTLSHQKKNKEGQWETTTVYLTRKIIPELMAGLQIQYQTLHALEIGTQQAPTNTAPPQPEPNLAGKIFKAVTDEHSITVGELSARFSATDQEVEAAVQELTAMNYVKVETKGLKMFVEVP